MTPGAEIPIPNRSISAEEQAAVSLLSDEELSAIDDCILSHCSDQFLKVARIMLHTERELAHRFPKLSHVFYTLRLRHLVGAGHLDAAGNLDYMRFSEVRLAQPKK